MTTRPKPSVFVLMPFAPEFDDVYKLGIKPACERAGAYAERVDEQLFAESILDRIYTQISKADVIIADMTGRNPNVFYETGYAHALGKNVVLLTKTETDIPFDLKHYPHIVYRGRIADLADELERRVRWAIENPRGLADRPEWDLEIFHDGVPLQSNRVIEHFGVLDVDAWNKIRLDIHNPARRRIQEARFQFGLVADRHVDRVRLGRRTLPRIKLEGGARYLHLARVDFSVLPGAWEPIPLQLRARGRFAPGDILDLTVRFFSDIGFRDYPFSIEIKELTIEANEDGTEVT